MRVWITRVIQRWIILMWDEKKLMLQKEKWVTRIKNEKLF